MCIYSKSHLGLQNSPQMNTGWHSPSTLHYKLSSLRRLALNCHTIMTGQKLVNSCGHNGSFCSTTKGRQLNPFCEMINGVDLHFCSIAGNFMASKNSKETWDSWDNAKAFISHIFEQTVTAVFLCEFLNILVINYLNRLSRKSRVVESVLNCPHEQITGGLNILTDLQSVASVLKCMMYKN